MARRSVKIGGDLSQWEGLPRYKVVLSNGVPTVPVKHEGYFSLAWDAGKLYVLGVFDQDRNTVVANLPSEAGEWWKDDVFELFVRTAPFAPKPEDLHYAVNPAGTRFKAYTVGTNYESVGRVTPGDAHAALELGFDGVMLESDDAAALRALAQDAHGRDAYVEAEYEVVGKGERHGRQHDLGELERFVRDSECDLLAVSIGTEHKQTEKLASLDFTHLREIAGRTSLPLVLHGASGVADEDLGRAARGGISKVNVATDLTLAFTGAARSALSDDRVMDPRAYLGAAGRA